MHNLKINNLSVSIGDKKILDNFNLEIKSGEVHTIMGPNGIGKSTLLKVIMGDDTYTITNGDILFDDESILDKTVDERANIGIFLGLQTPIEIEGVSNADFLRTACSTKNKNNFKLMHFIKELESNSDKLKLNKDFIHRDLNIGFSGGEKKKNEILQMYMLKPSIVLLDEIDSGLDVDSLKIVGDNVTEYKKESNCGILLITHYQRLLDYIKPDFVHIMVDGKIVKTGDYKLVKYIEDNGYNEYMDSSKKTEKLGTCIVRESLKNE